MNVSVVGRRLLMARRDLDMDQIELGKRTGISNSYISNIERLRVKSITVDVIESLARALDVAPQWLAGWSDDPLDGMPDLNSNDRTEIQDLVTLAVGLSQDDRSLLRSVARRLADHQETN